LPFSKDRASSSASRPRVPAKRRTPPPLKHRPVLAALKAKPCGRRFSAGLDRRCARAKLEKARRDEETLPRRTKKPDISSATKSGHLCSSLTGVSDTPDSKPEPVLAEAAPRLVPAPPPPSPSPEPHPAAALMHEPRIKSEDSHDAIMGPDGKMTYIPKKQAKQLTYAEVCEAAGATMKQRPRFR
jgi:hypothetical protein